MADYHFSSDWFETFAKPVWQQLIPQFKPRRVLEVGAFEGASACFFIEHAATGTGLDLHCIDSWTGPANDPGAFYGNVDWRAVESRFDENTGLACARSDAEVRITKHKGMSSLCLARLLCDGRQDYFDFVYIDGSHDGPDVLPDAVFGFHLLQPGGVMAFDDYLWAPARPTGDPTRCPKLAVDSFVNANYRKLRIIRAPLYQVHIQKLSN